MSTVTEIETAVEKLSPAKQRAIALHLGEFLVSAEHREELDRRLTAEAKDVGRPWSEVRAELLRR